MYPITNSNVNSLEPIGGVNENTSTNSSDPAPDSSSVADQNSAPTANLNAVIQSALNYEVYDEMLDSITSQMVLSVGQGIVSDILAEIDDEGSWDDGFSGQGGLPNGLPQGF